MSLDKEPPEVRDPYPDLKLTRSDRERLEPNISNFSRLMDYFATGEYTPDDLKKLIKLELSRTDPTKPPRREIVSRLLGRLHTTDRDTLLQRFHIRPSHARKTS